MSDLVGAHCWFSHAQADISIFYRALGCKDTNYHSVLTTLRSRVLITYFFAVLSSILELIF